MGNLETLCGGCELRRVCPRNDSDTSLRDFAATMAVAHAGESNALIQREGAYGGPAFEIGAEEVDQRAAAQLEDLTVPGTTPTEIAYLACARTVKSGDCGNSAWYAVESGTSSVGSE